MATIKKIFHFTSDVEGWVATMGQFNIRSGWYPPHRGANSVAHFYDTRNRNPLITMGGCLRMTSQNEVQSENYWELATTWTALGIPSGKSVSTVKADYLYRWGRFNNTISYHPNLATFLGTDTGSGPFELRDSG